MYRFPGRAVAGVGAGAAARDARLRHGIRVHGLAAVLRAGADCAAQPRPDGRRATTGSRTCARSGRGSGARRSRSIPTSISSRAPPLRTSRAARSRRRASPGHARPGALLPRRDAARASRDRRRRLARAHGNARGFRHRVVFHARGVHHRHLQGVVLDGRPRRRGATLGCLLAFVAVLLALERASRGPRRLSLRRAAQGRAAAAPARRAGAGLALAACAAPVLFGFLLPARRSSAGSRWADAGYSSARGSPRLVGQQLRLAAHHCRARGAACHRYGLRRAPDRAASGRPGQSRWSSLGYAVPGAVIAVGVLVPLGRLDNALAGWHRAAFGVKTGAAPHRHHRRAGVRLSGPVARRRAADDGGGARQHHAEHGDAARSLGATPGETLRRVHVPLLRRASPPRRCSSSST